MSANDLYGAAPARGSANDLYGVPAPAAAPHNILGDALGAIGEGAKRVGLPRVIDLLDRQRQAVQAGVARGPGAGVGTLVHGENRAQMDADRASVRGKLGGNNASERAQGHGLRGGIDDFLLDTMTDPVTFETAGVGPLLRVAGRAAGTIGKAAARVAPNATKEIGSYAHAVTDFFTHGGSAKRELGTPTYNRAMAADNRQGAREAEGKRILTERFEDAVQGLSDDEKRHVYRALNGEAQLTDPASGRLIVAPHVAEAHAKLDRLRNDMAALQADETGRRKLAFGKGNLANARLAVHVEPWDLAYAKRKPTTASGKAAAMEHPDDVAQFKTGPRRVTARADRAYELPPELQDIAAPADQGILGALNIRRNYLPGPREAAEVAPDAPARSFNLLRPFAPNALQRDEFQVGDKPEDLTALDEAFRGAAANAARQGTAGRMRAEIGVPLSPNAPTNTTLEKLFDRTSSARGEERSTAQKAGDRFRQVVQLPKNTVTTLGLKHGLINVPTLAAMSEGPGAALEALVGGAKLAGKGEAARYQALRPSIEGGVISPFEDRENPIADALARLPGPLGKAAGAAAKGANTLTWAIDDAAKQAVYRRKVARGMTPDTAAAETMREMVDYRHRSKATEALGTIAPFATFRSRLPAAIASAAVRHPERLLAADRATSGLSSNGKVDVGGHSVTMTQPISDVLELVNEPQKYARATLADPVNAAMTAAHVGLPTLRRDPDTGEERWQMQPNFFTRGQPLLPHHDRDGNLKAGYIGSQIAGYAPVSIGQMVLSGAGLSEFKPENLLSQLLGGTLGLHVR